MKRVVLLAGLLSAGGVWASEETPWVEVRAVDWARVLGSQGGERVRFGVRIEGPSPYERDSGAEFIPASTTKLFTASAALDLLGPGFRWQTRVRFRWADAPRAVADLRIEGSGDPVFDGGADRVVEALLAAGAREVRGAIRVSGADPRWDRPAYPFGWELVDRVECHGALPQAVNVAYNCARFRIESATAGRWLDPDLTEPVRVRLTIGPATDVRVRAPTENWTVPRELLVEGSVRSRAEFPFELELPVGDAPGWFAAQLERALASGGIARGEAIGESGPEQEIALLSPPLAEVLGPFLKDSINLIGDGLQRTLGERFGRADAELHEAGREVVARWLEDLGAAAARSVKVKEMPGYFLDQVRLWDGSGVSRANGVTPSALLALLQDRAARSDFAVLWEALAIAGVDGTLAQRMKGTAAEGILRAKTGTVRNFYNLAGYVPSLDGAFVPFVILSSAESADRSTARAAQDRAGAALAAAVRGAPLP